MIDPRELRIGNYISYYIYDQQNPHPDRIKSIYFDDESKEYRLEMESGKFSLDHLTIQGIKPIPLTEDILLKCGLKKVDCRQFNIPNTSLCLYDYFDKYEVIVVGCGYSEGIDTRTVIADITYLHELQNLYFALTGKELEVKL